MKFELVSGKSCGHPLEVCLKFDEMAEYLIRVGLGKEVSKEEALDIIKKSEEAGLVHFVDNAREGVKHNCNCCGCACWNLGAIKRRLVPRDIIIATYFIRKTAHEKCTGCGECIEICPVDAVRVENNVSIVDEDWCVGCGVCILKCANSAITLVRRTDSPAKGFRGTPHSKFKKTALMLETLS